MKGEKISNKFKSIGRTDNVGAMTRVFCARVLSFYIIFNFFLKCRKSAVSIYVLHMASVDFWHLVDHFFNLIFH